MNENNLFAFRKISKKVIFFYDGRKAPHIRYDPDGVMVWNVKRCENIPTTKEELSKVDNLLSEYQ